MSIPNHPQPPASPLCKGVEAKLRIDIENKLLNASCPFNATGHCWDKCIFKYMKRCLIIDALCKYLGISEVESKINKEE